MMQCSKATAFQLSLEGEVCQEVQLHKESAMRSPFVITKTTTEQCMPSRACARDRACWNMTESRNMATDLLPKKYPGFSSLPEAFT